MREEKTIDYNLRPGKEINLIGEVINKEKPIISIITPHYNGKRTAMETANSVLSQTFPFFEWIIIDDGSKDEDSLKLIRKISKMDKRIKLYEKENGGPSTARDFGIEKTSKSTKYVFFLDTDDIIDKNALEVFYWTLETHPEFSFVYTKMLNFEGEEFVWEKYLTTEDEKTENLICISSMVKKEDLLEVGCFGIKEKAMYEDWNLWLKLLSSGKKPIRITAPVFWYRFSNTGELSRAKENHKKAMKYVNRTAATIKKDVEIINFPFIREEKLNVNKNLKVLIPHYKKDKRKTILLVLPWTVRGGADLFNLEMIKRIDKTKYKIIVLSTLPTENVLWQDFNLNAEEYFDLSSFLETQDYLNFIDYIIESRNVDIYFTSHSKYGYSIIPYIKAKYPKISILDYIHSIDLKDKKGGFAKLSYDYDALISATYTCNKFTSNQLIKDFKKVKAETLYIGVDEEKFNIENFDIEDTKYKNNIPHDKTIISFIARLSDEKRPSFFIEIAKELLSQRDDLYFIIAGDGPLYDKVNEDIINNHLSEYFSVLGMVKDTAEIYSISDLTINCSTLEGIALTSYESLSMSIPVISSNVGGQSELIDDNVGKIVDLTGNEKEDIKVFANAANIILDNLNFYKKNSRKRILENFTISNMITKLEQIFDELEPTNNKTEKNIGIILYENFMKDNYKEFEYLVNIYYEEKFGVNLSKSTLKKSDRKLIKLEQSLKERAEKYKFIKEARRINLFLKTALFLGRSFQDLFKQLATFFSLLFKSIYSVFVIIGKYLANSLRSHKVLKLETGKILICLEKMDSGGVETFVLNQAIQLRKQGFTVYVMAERGIYSDKLVENKIKFIDFNLYDTKLNYVKIKDIINILEKNKIDQVIINQFPLLFSVLPACLITKTPYIAYLHMSNSLLKTDNVFDYYENQYTEFKKMFQIYFDNAYRIITIVDDVKYYISSRYKLNLSKILVKNNGISLDLYKNKKPIKEKTKFIFISRIDKQKENSAKMAIDLFVEYYKTNKKASLKIVGDGPSLDEIKIYAKEKSNKLDNIEILGSRNDVVELVENADIVMGMGRCLIEAMAMNRIPLLIGYDDIKGIITNKDIDRARKGNFAGRNIKNKDIKSVLYELNTLSEKDIFEITKNNHQYISENLNIKDKIYFIPKKELKILKKITYEKITKDLFYIFDIDATSK